MRQTSVALNAPEGFQIQRLNGAKEETIISQLLGMEKKLWKKSDSWGPDLEKELQRRNTFTLYAASSCSNPSVSAGSRLEVVGYLLYTATGLVAHISKVVVSPNHRRQGIARSLMQAAIQIAQKERRISDVTLHVSCDNLPALQLYQSLGFVEEGKLEDYYSPGRHAYKMRLQITDPY